MKIFSEQHKSDQHAFWQHKVLPFFTLLAMECALLLLDAVIPLSGLNATFRDALLTQLGAWPLLPTLLLFPHWAVIPALRDAHGPAHLINFGSWVATVMLFGVLIVIFLIYVLALRRLPRNVGRRYIVYSTLLLGITCALIPVVTSPDLYSYIAYARIGVIYHLNPLTTLPTAIRSDPVFSHVDWINQPSAYGPTWIAITCFLQWVTLAFGMKVIVPMVLSLRLLGLAMHLGSTLLIWSIGGYLQRQYGSVSAERRVLATLAFAWNPLLLFEACVNAHNDATILFLILLCIWFLVRCPLQTQLWNLLAAAVVFAIATCLKLNVLLLVPGLLIFLWVQRPRNILRIATPIVVYLGIIMLLYAPFWQNGAYLKVFLINPVATRNINSLPDFMANLYNSIVATLGYPMAPSSGSPAELVTHILSIGIFVIIYGLVCWRAMRAPHRVSTLPRLIRWLALVWLLYCLIGSPWYWPWYIVTFFGLYALIEATNAGEQRFLGFLRFPRAARLLAFSMLTLYCFYAFGLGTFPGLVGLSWGSLSGLWIWIVPLCARFKPELPAVGKIKTESDVVEHVEKQEIQEDRVRVG